MQNIAELKVRLPQLEAEGNDLKLQFVEAKKYVWEGTALIF